MLVLWRVGICTSNPWPNTGDGPFKSSQCVAVAMATIGRFQWQLTAEHMQLNWVRVKTGPGWYGHERFWHSQLGSSSGKKTSPPEEIFHVIRLVYVAVSENDLYSDIQILATLTIANLMINDQSQKTSHSRVHQFQSSDCHTSEQFIELEGTTLKGCSFARSGTLSSSPGFCRIQQNSCPTMCVCPHQAAFYSWQKLDDLLPSNALW